MKRSSCVLILTVLLSGCGGCEPGEQKATGSAPVGGSAAAPVAGKIEAAVGVAPTAARPPAAAQPTQGVAPQAAAPTAGAGQPEDDDCVVVADVNPDFGPPPLTVNFTAEAECRSGTPTYKWTFGDDSPPSTEPNPSHTYAKEGDFTATVTVTVPNGATSTDEVDIFVEEE